MAARVCGQTLILIDNDGTVSEVNQKIIKSTLKYMIYHSPENRAFCISTYTHELECEEVYTQDINELLCTVDLLEFSAKDSNLTDVLTKTISEWKEADFACRDILVFTDGMEGVNTEYETEELYYLIDNTSFPIYIVDLVQEGNSSAKKQLSAISTTSGGKLFMSEYPGDDGGVDKQLSEEIFGKMEEYANAQWGAYEDDYNQESQVYVVENSDENNSAEEEEAVYSEEGYVEEEYLEGSDELFGDVNTYETGTIVENRREEPFFGTTSFLVIGMTVVAFLVLAGFLVSFLIMKTRKNKLKEGLEVIDRVQEKEAKKDKQIDNPFEMSPFNDDFLMEEDGFENATRLLGQEDAATKLLSGDYSYRINLVDVEDPADIRTVYVDDYLTMGRKAGLSDVIFEDESISRKHCELSLVNGEFYVTDLASANGTFINDERITRKKLANGDRLTMGRKTYQVKYE